MSHEYSNTVTGATSAHNKSPYAHLGSLIGHPRLVVKFFPQDSSSLQATSSALTLNVNSFATQLSFTGLGDLIKIPGVPSRNSRSTEPVSLPGVGFQRLIIDSLKGPLALESLIRCSSFLLRAGYRPLYGCVFPALLVFSLGASLPIGWKVTGFVWMEEHYTVVTL